MGKRFLPFKSEKDLVDLFRAKQTCHRSLKNYSAVTEFECTHGIADVVLYELKKNWSENSAIGEINPGWVYSLRAIPYRKEFTLDYFGSVSGLSARLARKALKEFELAGFCEQKAKNGRWIKTRQPQVIARNISSFEAKLKNWRKALEQAYRYKEFSDQSWVIMDECHISPALERIQEFSERNIGLASINTNGTFKVHSKAMKESPRSTLNNWTANAKLAALLTSR
ncbi:hypothetical protein [Marinobacter sp.]|uniref:hypothetical protein n=1 Tax=Marinobacter sp. TaxID=50741 RepID=UPI003B518124